MEIRYIHKTDDRMEISSIYEESWKYAYKKIIPNDFLNSIEKGRWANVIDSPSWNTLVCIENGKYIGTSSFCKSRFSEYDSYGEIISIYLLPAYIGKGYGSQLLRQVIVELNNQGYNKILLWVLNENHRAKEFYKMNGFVETHHITNINIGGKELQEIMFVYKESK